ncbi:uncharacterized protein V1513DRAFT_455795 [Lipomyces chichibuensis]|uniref:uncharacterized protein n=1 Tax=Lipomyces chichibuensis TaxID=1546026 RepID=UPI003343337F
MTTTGGTRSRAKNSCSSLSPTRIGLESLSINYCRVSKSKSRSRSRSRSTSRSRSRSRSRSKTIDHSKSSDLYVPANPFNQGSDSELINSDESSSNTISITFPPQFIKYFGDVLERNCVSDKDVHLPKMLDMLCDRERRRHSNSLKPVDDIPDIQSLLMMDGPSGRRQEKYDINVFELLGPDERILKWKLKKIMNLMEMEPLLLDDLAA